MTSTRPNTWMPLYWADYWADTGHLSAAQHGAYLNLIGRYWTGGVPLPDNDGMLARLACMTAAEWRKARPVLQTFFEVADGVWRKGRIDRELHRANEILEARRKAGKQGGRHKQTDKQNESKPKPNGLANPKQNETPLPSPSPSKTDSEAEVASGADAPPGIPDVVSLAQVKPADGDWSKPLFRQGLAWLATASATKPNKLRSFIGQLLKLAGDDHERVFNLLAEAEARAIADPKAWLVAQLGGKLDEKPTQYRNGFVGLILEGDL